MPSRRKPTEPTYTRSAVEAALKAIRVPETQRERVMAELKRGEPRRGRKPKDIEDDVTEALVLFAEAKQAGKRMKVGTAARLVAAKYPESERNAREQLLAKRLRPDFGPKSLEEENERLRKRIEELERRPANKPSRT